MRMNLAAIASFMLVVGAPLPGSAEPRDCEANINGENVTILYDRDRDSYSSMRERHLTRRKTCPGAVVIAHMMPGLNEEQRSLFCAVYDEDAEYYRAPAKGERDAYGRCKRPSAACRLVNATKEEALAVAELGLDAAGAGLTAARDTSGAFILSGKAGALAGLLETAGASAAAALSAPGVLAGAAVSVVAVGGAVYLCAD
ncbi:hypothetical protein R5H32_19770 [Defluviimonas sp. D31]|uniref:hypothetical protein n=1 Tax=Defluviimonas sp. D31 TaxID=3083253 RepID=UPI00296EFE46|nr:hypothetical protein [Defluviimonas sp. D31]MDW4551586.1 hypothetical protein [Defluviimonas sp. D31]